MKPYKLIKFCTIAVAIYSLNACNGGNYSRVNEKQDTPSDIKISHLNTANKTIELRFEYRTYRERTLQEIKCNVNFNSGSSNLSLEKSPEIILDAFSKEILNFETITINNVETLTSLQNIDYVIKCSLNYDKGYEDVQERSVLHLIPGSSSSYR